MIRDLTVATQINELLVGVARKLHKSIRLAGDSQPEELEAFKNAVYRGGS